MSSECAGHIIERRWLGAGAGSDVAGGTLTREARPLPLATNRVWLSGLTATAVGYQPTGMKPSMTETIRRAPRSSEMLFEISTTITQLLSASHEQRAPSGETATPRACPPASPGRGSRNNLPCSLGQATVGVGFRNFHRTRLDDMNGVVTGTGCTNSRPSGPDPSFDEGRRRFAGLGDPCQYQQHSQSARPSRSHTNAGCWREHARVRVLAD